LHPILFKNSIFEVSSLWFITTIGIIISFNFFLTQIRRKRLSYKLIIKNQFYLIIGVILGARIGGIISNWSFYEPFNFFQKIISFFRIWDNQMSLSGGILTFILLLLLFIKLYEDENFGRWMDVTAQSVLILYFFHSIANYFEGQEYGRETALPWAVIPENTNVKYAVPIHPTQIYAAIYILTIFFSTNILTKKIEFFKTPGLQAVLIFIGYSGCKFLESLLRGDDVITILNIRYDTFFSFLFFILGIIILTVLLSKINQEFAEKLTAYKIKSKKIIQKSINKFKKITTKKS